MMHLSSIQQLRPLLSFRNLVKTTMGHRHHVPVFRPKHKVIFVMGPTGAGKSRLAVDLAARFPAEIINSDKIQAYKGLDVTTNKVTEGERRGVPHHLLGYVDPDSDFSPLDFRDDACRAIESVVARDRTPVVAGGSNSYIERLVDGCPEFRLRYDCCCLWIDVAMPVLHSFVSDRVDRMVELGLIDEVRDIFDPKSADYSHGIRRAIGVPELDRYLRSEHSVLDRDTKARLLDEAVVEVKKSTCALASRQLQKIHRLYRKWDWNMHRMDATDLFVARDSDVTDVAWDVLVVKPSMKIVDRFLYGKTQMVLSTASASYVSFVAAVLTQSFR